MSINLITVCSAGVGRTGTYIALDMLLRQAEAEGVVNVPDTVNRLREGRVNMVQNQVQLTELRHGRVNIVQN